MPARRREWLPPGQPPTARSRDPQSAWSCQSGSCLRRRLRERRHRAAGDPERCAGNRPRKYRQPRQPVDDAGLAGRRRDEVVAVVGGYEDAVHLEVAAPGAAQPGDVPGVVNGHLLAREVAADRRLAAAAAVFHGSQSHESGGMTGATAERPASGDAIASRDGLSRADRAGGAGDKCVGIGKPLLRGCVRQIAGDAAHAAAICDDPADGSVFGRCRLHHLHEIGGRQFGAAHRRRQPQAKQSGFGQRAEHDVRKPAVAIEARAVLFYQRRKVLDGVEVFRKTRRRCCQHVSLSRSEGRNKQLSANAGHGAMPKIFGADEQNSSGLAGRSPSSRVGPDHRCGSVQPGPAPAGDEHIGAFSTNLLAAASPTATFAVRLFGHATLLSAEVLPTVRKKCSRSSFTSFLEVEIIA